MEACYTSIRRTCRASLNSLAIPALASRKRRGTRNAFQGHLLRHPGHVRSAHLVPWSYGLYLGSVSASVRAEHPSITKCQRYTVGPRNTMPLPQLSVSDIGAHHFIHSDPRWPRPTPGLIPSAARPALQSRLVVGSELLGMVLFLLRVVSWQILICVEIVCLCWHSTVQYARVYC